MRRALALAWLGMAMAGSASAQALPTIYFAPGQDQLDAPAKKQVEAAVALYRAAAPAQVVIAGHTSRAGDAEANLKLSERRAHTVLAWIVALGVPYSATIMQGFGEARPAVETADGVSESKNDRVDLSLAPASGW